LEWGPQIEKLEALEESGVQVKALDDKPNITGLEFYFGAYCDLQSDRQIGMDIGPIPWTSVVRWCRLHGIHDIDDIDTINRYLRAMERAEYSFRERKRGDK
jgi:hypothetical protein